VFDKLINLINYGMVETNSWKCGIKLVNEVIGGIHVISTISVMFYMLPITVWATVKEYSLKVLGICCGLFALDWLNIMDLI